MAADRSFRFKRPRAASAFDSGQVHASRTFVLLVAERPAYA